MSKSPWSSFVLATAFAALLAAPACGGDEDDPDPPGTARLRVVHASPDAPAVDVGTVTGGALDAPALVADLAFAEATSGDGLAVPPAALTLGIAAAGTTDPVATFDVTTEAGLRAYAVAAGALAPADDRASFRLILVVTSTWPWVSAAVMPN